MTYEFGDFELDATRRLLVTRTGAPVEITGRVLDTLIYLVERPGQLIDKKALIDAVWPNVVVEDGNLTQTIHTLRRVLGEKAGEHRYIVTVPGRGYQFVAEVKERVAPSAPAPVAAPVVGRAPSRVTDVEPGARSRPFLAIAVISLVLFAVVGVLAWRGRAQPGHSAQPAQNTADVAHPSIAVLPFVDMSSEQDQGHFAEGLSEEILNILAHADNLRVIARTSSFSFKDENADIKTIAQRLGVSNVLEGSVRKSGDRLRITAQLIDARTSAHVWSDTYDRNVTDIFGVQREIALAVADALKVSLARAAPRRAETMSTEAYEHYLEGRLLFNRRSGTDLLQAKVNFEKAVQIDPNYGRAWAGLAGVYFVSRFEKLELPNALEKWGEAAERGVQFAPDLAEAHARLAQYQLYTGKLEDAQKHFARATALDPEDPMSLGIKLSDAIAAGKMQEAVDVTRHMVAVDPLSANNRNNLGSMLIMVGRYPEAQAELERALELSPAQEGTMLAIADVLILQKRFDEAMVVIARLPDDHFKDGRLAVARFARGDERGGNEVLARLRAAAEKPDADPDTGISVAEVYAMRGDVDRAFEWLERSRPRTGSPLEGLPSWEMFETIQVSPFLMPLQTDPRWRKLLTALDEQGKQDAVDLASSHSTTSRPQQPSGKTP